MPTEFSCPGCGNRVALPDVAAVRVGFSEEVGCLNVEEHDDGEPKVMWEDGNE